MSGGDPDKGSGCRAVESELRGLGFRLLGFRV